MIACPAPQPVARTAPRSLRLPRTVSFLLLSWAAGALLGAPLYPDRGRRSELLKPCDEHYDRGRRGQAAGCYRELIDRSADPAAQAEAFWRLGDLKSANERFRDAVNASPDDPDLRVRWGYLYVQSHQEGEAAKLFAEALERDKNHVAAKLGAASVMAGRFEGEALERVNEALEAKPEQVGGYLLLARMALEEGDLEKAEKSLRTALEKVESLQASPLETYALLASLDLLRQNPDSEWIDKALAHNPAFGKIYAEQAHFYVITRRYRQATERLRKAVALDPTLWQAHADLGVNLMREGLEGEGRRRLEIAYNGDPYSAKTVNTLRLMDSFGDFVTLSNKERAAPADEQELLASLTKPEILVKLHKDEAELLRPYVFELSERAVAGFSKKYDFTPEKPIQIELYPNHDDFAVRTMAMPGIGLLGVTFGYVVAMDSPSGREPGGFHWGTTLWHELAHVFTLEATDHLAPRWYSEGVSMYEEWQGDPRWGESIGPDFISAVRQEKLLPIAELDRGFIRPRFPGQVQISYMQAGLVCRFIAREWGEEKLAVLLRGFARNTSTADNIEAALGLDAEEFDSRFQDYLREFIGPVLDGLKGWRGDLQKALEAAREEDWESVVEPAVEAKQTYPQYVGSGNPYVLLAEAYDRTGKRDAAIGELSAYERRGGRNPEMLKKLGKWLAEAGRGAEAAWVYEGIVYNWPQDEEVHRRLGDLLYDQGEYRRAAREFHAVLALDPLNKADADYNLARTYDKMGDRRKARRHVLLSLENAPTFGPALKLLMKIKE